MYLNIFSTTNCRLTHTFPKKLTTLKDIVRLNNGYISLTNILCQKEITLAGNANGSYHHYRENVVFFILYVQNCR